MLKFDEIGYWSEIKLEIIKEYASAYSKILTAQKAPPLYHIYIDAFSGPGVHISKTTKGYIKGSPLNALQIDPPFREYHLIDLDHDKIDFLRRLVKGRTDVFTYQGDCKDILIEKVLPRVQFKDYRRGLCLLDPYGLQLNWNVIYIAGQMRTIDIFLNFPVADINRNVLWRNLKDVDCADIKRMNNFWGDDSWRDVAYSTNKNLFGIPEKEDNEVVAEGFRNRLINVAGFNYVPRPIPMRNSKNATIYYLFFASNKVIARDIIDYIFDKFSR